VRRLRYLSVLLVVLLSLAPRPALAHLPVRRAQSPARYGALVSSAAVPVAQAAAPQASTGDDTTSEFSVDSPLYDAVRWIGYVALLAMIGMVIFARSIVPRVTRYTTGIAALATRADRGAARAASIAAIFLFFDALARLIAQSYAVNGASDAWDFSLIGAIVGHTLWGWGWILEAIAALVAITAFASAVRGRRGGWLLGGLAILALALAFALSGHAVATPRLTTVAVISDMLHLLGAGAWLGTLLAVVAVGIPLALREPGGPRGRVVADFVNAFSPVALTGAALVALTGLLAAWMHVGTLDALWHSPYGRLLLLKLAVIALVAAFGAFNWRVLRPSLGDVRTARRIRSSAVAELAMGALVLAITAVLVVTPPPADMAQSAAVPTPGTAADAAP
jgi:putative copper export protein